jgi:hypothetical protein
MNSAKPARDSSLKAGFISAQGNALGYAIPPMDRSPEGAILPGVICYELNVVPLMCPFRALRKNARLRFPGPRFALGYNNSGPSGRYSKNIETPAFPSFVIKKAYEYPLEMNSSNVPISQESHMTARRPNELMKMSATFKLSSVSESVSASSLRFGKALIGLVLRLKQGFNRSRLREGNLLCAYRSPKR